MPVGLLFLLACGSPKIPVEPIEQVLFLRNLQPGDVVEEADVGVQRWRARHTEGTYLQTEHVVGQMVKEPVYAGELVFSSHFAAPESNHGLSAVVPRRMNAITIPIDPAQGLWVDPGDYVDIWLKVDGRACVAEQVVFVLARDEKSQRDRAGGGLVESSLTLLGTHEHTLTLALWARQPGFRVTVRNPSDTTLPPEQACWP